MRKLECRVVVRLGDRDAEVGMYDPLNEKYERLGRHPYRDLDKVVKDLKNSIEQAGHLLTCCTNTG